MEIAIEIAALVQLFVWSIRDDPAVLEYQNTAGTAQGTEAMGDYDRRLPGQQPIQCDLDLLFTFRIECGGSLIQNEQGRIS